MTSPPHGQALLLDTETGLASTVGTGTGGVLRPWALKPFCHHPVYFTSRLYIQNIQRGIQMVDRRWL